MKVIDTDAFGVKMPLNKVREVTPFSRFTEAGENRGTMRIEEALPS